MSLAKLKESILDVYVDFIQNKGPMYVFMKECATGYIHSFYMRGLVAEWERTRNKKYLDAAKAWTELSIKLQGTYGDSAAFNMGYLFETKNNISHSWFIADTLDQAYGMLNVASTLDPHDPLYIKILDSVLRYDKYIQQWFLGIDGFALGYIDGEYSSKKAYHTASTRGVCYYAALYKILGKIVFKDKGLALLESVLEQLDMDSNYHGSPLHNRCYASDALVCAYYVLAVGNKDLQARIKNKMNDAIIAWALQCQTEDGFWAHDRFGHQPGAMSKVDKSRMGVYSWGMVAGIEIFAKSILPPDREVRTMLDRAYAWLETYLIAGDINRWGYHSWATLAIHARLSSQHLFPYGDFLLPWKQRKSNIMEVPEKSRVLQTV